VNHYSHKQIAERIEQAREIARADRLIEELGQAEELAPLTPEKPKTPFLYDSVGFSDTGKPVPIARFDPETIDAPPTDTEPDSVIADTRLETVRALLGFLALGERNLRKIGWRAALFCHLVFPNESQRDFAKRLRVSEAALSANLKDAKRELGLFLRADMRHTDPKSESRPLSENSD
jgi:hypothetical protein